MPLRRRSIDIRALPIENLVDTRSATLGSEDDPNDRLNEGEAPEELTE